MSKILTLNIGASKALLAEYAVSGNNLSLMAYGSGDLPAIDVNDPGSVTAALPSVLYKIMREKGIRPAPLVVALSGQTVFPRFAKFPALGDAEKLEQLVRYEIEQNVPFPIDEIVSDYQFLGTSDEGDKTAIIVAAKLEAVRAVTDAVRSVGLKPSRVDVSPMAICNALKWTYPDLAGCNVILDIGSKTTNLVILEGEKIYNRSIPLAGNTMTKELAQAFGCTFEEAEQLKLERGYVSLGGTVEDEDEVTDRVSKVLRTVLTRLHAEISRSINFYRSQQGGSAPARLFLTGGTARMPRLVDFFQESLQIQVDVLNPLAHVKIGSKVNRAALDVDAFTLTESVGLALRETPQPWISINLMPPELVSEARAVKRIPFIAAGALAFLGALGCVWWTLSTEKARVMENLQLVHSRNTQLEAKKTELSSHMKALTANQEMCAKYANLMWQRSMSLKRMNLVRKCISEDGGQMWIKSWQVDTDKNNTQKLPENVEAVIVTVRGWSKNVEAAEQKWKKTNKGKNASVIEEIVVEKLRVRYVAGKGGANVLAAGADGKPAKVEKGARNEDNLIEFQLRVLFANGTSIAGRAQK